MPNIATILQAGIKYISGGANYVIRNTQTNAQFLIYNAHIQQIDPATYNRPEADITGRAVIQINVPIAPNNIILEGKNKYGIMFNGNEYIITDALDQAINGYMRYTAMVNLA